MNPLHEVMKWEHLYEASVSCLSVLSFLPKDPLDNKVKKKVKETHQQNKLRLSFFFFFFFFIPNRRQPTPLSNSFVGLHESRLSTEGAQHRLFNFLLYTRKKRKKKWEENQKEKKKSTGCYGDLLHENAKQTKREEHMHTSKSRKHKKKKKESSRTNKMIKTPVSATWVSRDNKKGRKKQQKRIKKKKAAFRFAQEK